MTQLHARSPAKLNLFLHVLGRREDGYHNLQTVFQLLNWGDDMIFELQETPGITLTGDTNDLSPRENLIVRAAESLANPEEKGVRIHISKRIPRGGGLGVLVLGNVMAWRVKDDRTLTCFANIPGMPVFLHSCWKSETCHKLAIMLSSLRPFSFCFSFSYLQVDVRSEP